MEGAMMHTFAAKSEDYEWRDREIDKVTARPVVWNNESWWQNSMTQTWHCAHVSSEDPTQIAFTPSFEYGRANRQVRMKPGRYLGKFYSDCLTPKQIQFYAQWWTTGSKPETDSFKGAELKFATTRDEIVAVYVDGPDSCMDGNHFKGRNHPCSVYAAGDLGIAYLEMPDEGVAYTHKKIFARALVWPEKKVFGRVYPTLMYWREDGFAVESESTDAQDLLFNRLKAEGYKSINEGANFNGARLLKLECSRSGGWIMPYLDNGYGVSDKGSYWHMERNSWDYSAQETEGYIEGNRRPECESCGDDYDEQDGGVAYACISRSGYPRSERHICSYCSNNLTFFCGGSNEYYLSDCVESIETVDSQTFARQWAVNNGFYQSAHSEDWFNERDDPRAYLRDGTPCSQSEREEEDKEHDEDDESAEAETSEAADHV